MLIWVGGGAPPYFGNAIHVIESQPQRRSSPDSIGASLRRNRENWGRVTPERARFFAEFILSKPEGFSMALRYLRRLSITGTECNNRLARHQWFHAIHLSIIYVKRCKSIDTIFINSIYLSSGFLRLHSPLVGFLCRVSLQEKEPRRLGNP